MEKEKKKMSTKKKVILGIIIAVIAAILIGIAVFWVQFFPSPFAKKVSPNEISTGAISMTGDSDTLVAYFSLAVNREYTSQEVDAVSSASLKINDGNVYGHAEWYAIEASEAADADLFPILVKEKYPESYSGAFAKHREESAENARPELITHVENMEAYQTVILIYPNWLSGTPHAVQSFLKEYDFSGKTIVPIATSQALGLGSSPEQIAALCPDATVAEGLSVKSSENLREFLTENGYAQ